MVFYETSSRRVMNELGKLFDKRKEGDLVKHIQEYSGIKPKK